MQWKKAKEKEKGKRKKKENLKWIYLQKKKMERYQNPYGSRIGLHRGDH